MSPDKAAIRIYFMKLGLSKEIADIYLSLHQHGPQTISALSRSSNIERTRIYRLVDKLLSSNLIEVESHYKRGIIKAAPISNLHILINQKEQELKSLQDELNIIEQVFARNSLSNPITRVQFYHGAEGIRQMLWNELSCKSEQICYSYQILDFGTGNTFMDRWASEFEKRGIKRRIVFGEDFVRSWQDRKPYGHRIKGVTYNYIKSSIFPITHSCDVYDDVTSYYNWKDKEVFGIEIYNRQIADAQKLFIEALWQQSNSETRF
jgi:sugar-specific transcriptional regulator TrmB